MLEQHPHRPLAYLIGTPLTHASPLSQLQSSEGWSSHRSRGGSCRTLHPFRVQHSGCDRLPVLSRVAKLWRCEADCWAKRRGGGGDHLERYRRRRGTDRIERHRLRRRGECGEAEDVTDLTARPRPLGGGDQRCPRCWPRRADAPLVWSARTGRAATNPESPTHLPRAVQPCPGGGTSPTDHERSPRLRANPQHSISVTLTWDYATYDTDRAHARRSVQCGRDMPEGRSDRYESDVVDE
jgi:hypothetical protein